MSRTQRQEEILQHLHRERFATVRELSERTFISPSSTRRDLAELEHRGLVRRTHGGVTLPETVAGVASFQKRKEQNVQGKRLLAKKAARFLADGQSIMLDSSSTVSFLLPYIARHSGIRLFTNNLSTAMDAIALGIDTCCIGGHAAQGSVVLGGPLACQAMENLRFDTVFFSSQSLDEEGVISDSCEEENYLRQLMLRRASRKIFLCDREKLGKRSLHTLCRLDQVDEAVFE